MSNETSESRDWRYPVEPQHIVVGPRSFNSDMGLFGYIYITENLINGKRYIGQHKSRVFDNWYCGSGLVLKKALKKYGKKNFKCSLIEWGMSREDLDDKEKYWIRVYDAVNSKYFYNMGCGGEGFQRGELNPMYGRTHTDEVRKIISEKRMGTHLSEETKRKLRGPRECLQGNKNGMFGNGYLVAKEKNGMYGKIHTIETRELMSKWQEENNPIRVKVFCKELKMTFRSLLQASEYVGLKYSGDITKSIKRGCSSGKYLVDGKVCSLHWEIIDEGEDIS